LFRTQLSSQALGGLLHHLLHEWPMGGENFLYPQYQSFQLPQVSFGLLYLCLFRMQCACIIMNITCSKVPTKYRRAVSASK
jgi:hypothetical protein